MTSKLLEVELTFYVYPSTFRCADSFSGPTCIETTDVEEEVGSPNTIAIAFGVVGVVFLIGLIIFLAVMCSRRNQKNVQGRYMR
jgi:hypothetical protein